jgi:hypothetical protein
MGNVIQFPSKTPEGRTPLYVSYLDGQIRGRGGDTFQRHDAETFDERMTRVKESLEKINKLMEGLRV